MDNLSGQIDQAFPIKINGAESYRKYQKEAIREALEHLAHEDHIAIEGPVGSGKSAINVTLARLLDGRSVYITPQVDLQSQIMNEGWEDMACVKGKSRYLCSACGGAENTYEKYSCDYEGMDFKTCNNTSKKISYTESDDVLIADYIYAVNNKFKNNKPILEVKTSFSSPEHFYNIVSRLTLYLEELGIRKNKPFKYPRAAALKMIGCKLHTIECPARSKKVLSIFKKITVLNPDVLFNILKNPNSHLHDINTLVFDECHQVEGVVERIFKMKIPLGAFKEIFNIDVSRFERPNLSREEACIEISKFIKEELGPTIAAGRTLSKTDAILRLRNHNSILSLSDEFYDIKDSMNEFFEKNSRNPKWEYPILKFYDAVFKNDENLDNKIFGSCSVMYNFVRSEFLYCCKQINCDIEYYGFLKLNGCNISDEEKEQILDSRNDKDSSVYNTTLSTFMKCCKSLREVISNFQILENLSEIVKPYFLNIKYYTIKSACEDFKWALDHFKKRLDEVILCIEVVPVDTGKIMRNIFYKKNRKVILSSGTWVGDKKKLYNLRGLGENAHKINIPNMFPIKNRKVYVIISDAYIDFSEKINGIYTYKTEHGKSIWIPQLRDNVKRIRNGIKKNFNISNCNVIIHCNSFDLSKIIQENVDILSENSPEKWLIHHKHNNKQDLISVLEKNHDSGYVLVSPSVHEGYDFKYGIARGQILLKCPIPNTTEPYIDARSKGCAFCGIERDYTYIDNKIFTTVLQMIGRIIRADDDVGISIVFDQALSKKTKFIMDSPVRRKEMNCEYLFEAVEFLYLDK